MVHIFSKQKDGKEPISPHFKVIEFACKDGSDTILIDTDFVYNYLQHIRDVACAPIIVNSGYRTPAYNKKVGGAKNSYHMQGRAFDIRCAFQSPTSLAQIAEQIGVKGIILYNHFVHVDSRERKYFATNINGKITRVTTFSNMIP